jgi:capsule polysaccharide export protein KpsE/RkpR
LVPQQQQSSALATLAALAPGGSPGGSALKSPADQYVALMQSATVQGHLVDRFDLVRLYEKKYRVDARHELDKRAHITAGKKDGIVVVEVEDESPKRAADMANRYIDELRELTSRLALTEAQQRRIFFEGQLQQTKQRLTRAQTELESSGFSAGAIKSEPKAAAEGYARIKAETTATEVRIQTLRSYLTDSAPELRQAQDALRALQQQMAKLDQSSGNSGNSDYIGKYRAFKYEEALFDLFARQYELARVDESREGALIQVVDEATPPERKSKPSRALITLGFAIGGPALLGCALLANTWFRNSFRPRLAIKKLQTFPGA